MFHRDRKLKVLFRQPKIQDPEHQFFFLPHRQLVLIQQMGAMEQQLLGSRQLLLDHHHHHFLTLVPALKLDLVQLLTIYTL